MSGLGIQECRKPWMAFVKLSWMNSQRLLNTQTDRSAEFPFEGLPLLLLSLLPERFKLFKIAVGWVLALLT